MNTAPFYEDGSRVLTPEAFDFVLGCELRRAVRSRSFLTLVTVEARRMWDGLTVAADDATVADLAALVAPEVRETDLLAQADRGLLWLVLLDADVEGSRQVIDRLVSRVDNYRFPAPTAVQLGAASCPTHAVDAESLKREALSRPVVSARRQVIEPHSRTDRT
jgi:hypothetical protein